MQGLHTVKAGPALPSPVSGRDGTMRGAPAPRLGDVLDDAALVVVKVL